MNGFEVNSVDECVFNKLIDGKQVTIVLYVDDLLLISSVYAKNIAYVQDIIQQEFKEIKVKKGQELTYLGMLITHDKAKSRMKINMSTYVESILEMWGKDIRCYPTPTVENLHEDTNEELSPDREKFHTAVAKLLYLALRGRPDILLAVQHLSTRVSRCNNEDVKKLERVLGFIKLTKKKSRIFDGSTFYRIVGMIDAAFSSHHDGYGQSGMVIFAGNNATAVKSVKQGCSSKDSTEAEIIAMSDMMLRVQWHHEWWTSQGKDLHTPFIYQDNTSAIALMTKQEKIRNYETNILEHEQALSEIWFYFKRIYQ